MTNDFYTCPICNGEGYEYEQVDDKREKRPCPCNEEYAKSIIKTATERRNEGIAKIKKRPDYMALNGIMDEFLHSKSSETHRHTFTSDSFRNFAGEINDMHQNSWGALFSSYAKKGIIQKTGEYRKSVRPSSHGRVIPVWQIN